jgi:two-component system chemotaxis sensor kinase CheA
MNAGTDLFHEAFFEESFEAVDAMEAAVLRLVPGVADNETINTIFRVAHSIKGGAGMFGFNQIAAFTHTVEALLDALRSGRLQVSPPMCDGLLQSVDALRAMLAAQRNHHGVDLTVPRMLQAEFLQMIGEEAVRAPAPVVAAIPVVAPDAQSAAMKVWNIRFRALPGLLGRGHDPLRMFEELGHLGEVTTRADLADLPELADIDPAHCRIRWELLLKCGAPRAAIEQVFEWAGDDCELTIEPAGEADEAPEPAAVAPQSSSIRVAIEKLDELQHKVGEVASAQSLLGELAREFQGSRADSLRRGIVQLETALRGLQESVTRMRMLPASTMFNRFPRLVRDLSARLGKQIRLQISGGRIELDKTVLEKIGDPLVHLVRNSIDHGIELPAERIAAGKPAEGLVRLKAFYKGGSIHIVISDDGRGLDSRKLLARARSTGLVDADAVLTDQQAHELIFVPGFTTAEQATELSGRGVGMDVVSRNIQELGGHVELRSQPGKGTTTTITLPLTLAVIDGQVVQVGAETHILPLLRDIGA